MTLAKIAWFLGVVSGAIYYVDKNYAAATYCACSAIAVAVGRQMFEKDKP